MAYALGKHKHFHTGHSIVVTKYGECTPGLLPLDSKLIPAFCISRNVSSWDPPAGVKQQKWESAKGQKKCFLNRSIFTKVDGRERREAEE